MIIFGQSLLDRLYRIDFIVFFRLLVLHAAFDIGIRKNLVLFEKWSPKFDRRDLEGLAGNDAESVRHSGLGVLNPTEFSSHR